MPYQTYGVTCAKAELRSKAMAEHLEELSHLKPKIDRLDELLLLFKQLTTEQARLTAARQEISKQIEGLNEEAQKLLTFLDVAIRQHYGNRSETLAAFGLQPFRSKPRARRAADPEGKPAKRKATRAKAKASPKNE